MIARLTGLLDSTGEDWAVVDVGGVGYLVQCSARTLSQLPGRGERVSLAVETHMREDRIQLYGFLEQVERDWFRLLTTVQGVGAKVALGLLSVMGPGEMSGAIAAQDKAAISRAQGVGPRLAGRILSELRDRVGGISPSSPTPGGGPSPVDDAVSALVNLGYARTDAHGAVLAAARSLGDEASVEDLIRSGLKELAA